MTVLFQKDMDGEDVFDYEEILTNVIRETIEKEECPYECEINLTLTDNEGIRRINREYRDLDVPTDVLSFPMAEYEIPADFSILDTSMAKIMYFNLDTGELLLGDIVISLERAQEQAEEYGHTLERELAFLTVHSVLHLIGYDHIEDDEREVMEKKQENILQDLGITR